MYCITVSELCKIAALARALLLKDQVEAGKAEIQLARRERKKGRRRRDALIWQGLGRCWPPLDAHQTQITIR